MLTTDLWVLSPHNPGGVSRKTQVASPRQLLIPSPSYFVMRSGSSPLSPLESQCFDPWSSATVPWAVPCRRDRLFGVPARRLDAEASLTRVAGVISGRLLPVALSAMGRLCRNVLEHTRLPRLVFWPCDQERGAPVRGGGSVAFEVASPPGWGSGSRGAERGEILALADCPLKRPSPVEVTCFPCGPAFENQTVASDGC